MEISAQSTETAQKRLANCEEMGDNKCLERVKAFVQALGVRLGWDAA